MIHRRSLLAVGSATALAGTARAQDNWPNRPVSVLVPFVAGGPSDIVARIIAPRLAESSLLPDRPILLLRIFGALLLFHQSVRL